MSSLELKNRLPLARQVEIQASDSVPPLRWYEKLLLAAGIIEIPLQIDKYFMFHETDADLGAVGGINVSITTLSLIALYVLWIAQVLGGAAGSMRKLIIGWPMVFYIGVVCLSTFASSNKLLVFFDIVLLVQAYLLFFYIANRVRTLPNVKVLLLVFLGALLVQSFVILGLRAMGESIWGEPFEIGPIVFSVWESGRAAGTMHSPVLAGSFLATFWLPALVLFTMPVKGMLRWLAIVGVIAGGVALLVTQTRGAILTTAIGTIAIGSSLSFRGWLPPRLISIALVLAVVGIIPVIQLVKARVIDGDGGSAGSRVYLSAIAVDIIQEKPFFGHGAGNCHLVGQKYADQARYRSLWYYTVHNKYLLVWVETGAVGLLAFLAILYSSVRDGIRVWASKHRILAPLGLGFAVAILGQMLHMSVDLFNSRTQVQVLWAILGAIAGLRATMELGPQTEAVADDPFGDATSSAEAIGHHGGLYA